MSVMLDNSATDNVGVSFIDSFTVNTSTVQLDNLPSAGTGSIIVGRAEVPNIGTLSSTSYFPIGFTSFENNIPQTAVFDSLSLVLRTQRAKYYYGDTTSTQKINVHRLTQTLENQDLLSGIQNKNIPIYITGPNIFTKQKFDYAASPIGSVTFAPRVRALDSLNIRLSNSIGQEIFDMIRANDIKVASNDNFQEYFKGLAIVPDAGNTTTLAFNDTIQFKINYSYTGTDGFKKTEAKILSITQKHLQFNNVEYDRKGTAFADLSVSKNEIKTTATAGVTLMQAGTGVVAKMSFPSLKEFLMDENLSVNKAELVIETSTPSTNTMYPIPGALMLFVADHDNIPISFISSPYGTGIQQAGFIPGNQTGKNGTYTFNLINYLKSLKSTSSFDDKSLFLSVPSPGLFSTFNTTFIATENAKPKIKLNILYTKFR
ncbi:DUF4270 family protein [Sphingobacterium sp. MYb382]